MQRDKPQKKFYQKGSWTKDWRPGCADEETATALLTRAVKAVRSVKQFFRMSKHAISVKNVTRTFAPHANVMLVAKFLCQSRVSLKKQKSAKKKKKKKILTFRFCATAVEEDASNSLLDAAAGKTRGKGGNGKRGRKTKVKQSKWSGQNPLDPGKIFKRKLHAKRTSFLLEVIASAVEGLFVFFFPFFFFLFFLLLHCFLSPCAIVTVLKITPFMESQVRIPIAEELEDMQSSNPQLLKQVFRACASSKEPSIASLFATRNKTTVCSICHELKLEQRLFKNVLELARKLPLSFLLSLIVFDGQGGQHILVSTRS